MAKICRFVAAQLFLLASPAANASQSSAEPIVVKGTRIEPAEARQRAVEFIKRAGVAKGGKQVARWVVPICIKVIGIRDDQAARFKQNMLGIAREARMDIARAKCEPNITVSFTNDPKQVVHHIKTRQPNQLRELSFADRERVLTGDAPVRWWYSTQMLDRDGVKANNISTPSLSSGGGSGAQGTGSDPVSLPMNDGVTATQQYNSGSNVRTPTVRSLYAATVVVGAQKADMPIEAIAAYAAMVALAEMDYYDPPPLDSILGMFRPESTETALTGWDLAFLKSLYRMPLDRRSRIQRGHLVNALLDERLPKESTTKKP